jgi:hypothetical protein
MTLTPFHFDFKRRDHSLITHSYRTYMIEVDDLELDDDDREFLKEWADNLNETVPVLIGRILLAAIEGVQYVEKRPKTGSGKPTTSTKTSRCKAIEDPPRSRYLSNRNGEAAGC